MNKLFTTFCAAAMVVAQPAFSNQSENILGTWDCIQHTDEFFGTETVTYYPDGNLATTAKLSGQIEIDFEVELAMTATGTWHIANNTIHTDITHLDFDLLVLNGNDLSTDPVADSYAQSFLSDSKTHEAIQILDYDYMIKSGDDGSTTECTRYVGA